MPRDRSSSGDRTVVETTSKYRVYEVQLGPATGCINSACLGGGATRLCHAHQPIDRNGQMRIQRRELAAAMRRMRLQFDRRVSSAGDDLGVGSTGRSSADLCKLAVVAMISHLICYGGWATRAHGARVEHSHPLTITDASASVSGEHTQAHWAAQYASLAAVLLNGGV